MSSAKKALLLPNTEGGERNGYHIHNHLNMLCIGHKPIAYPPENRQGLFHPDRLVDNPFDRPLYIRSHHRIAR